METNETLIEQVDDLAAAWTPDNLCELDLDRIRDLLGRHRRLLAEHESLREDLAALRQDYVARIGGMAKAIAAVTRRTGAAQAHDAAAAVLEYLRTLETMTAAQLIEQYRLAGARFRDAFPTSFGRLP